MRVPRFLFALPLLICAPLPGQQRTSKSIRTGQGQNPIAALSRKALPAVMMVVAFDKSEKELGQGSGFFVSRDGKLVTNYHVIENASSAFVKLGNGAFYAVAGVVALDRERDLAVLKASGREFPVLPLGNSESVRVGESVIAIGSPLALEGTVSNGIVSGVRELRDGELTVFQTTAPISPGSSGGPLLNLKGEVIGVTAYHLVQGENLNFAIAGDHIKPLLSSKLVTPFQPKESTAQENPGPELQKTENLADIPREWTNLLDGHTVTVRIEGDYLYEQATIPSSISFDAGHLHVEVRERSYVCDIKRQGGTWGGKCRQNWKLYWSIGEDRTCTFELVEIITSVTPRRIEGDVVNVRFPSDFPDCPGPGTGWKHFALIPKE